MKTASVIATRTGDRWGIRGYTRPYVDILKANDCAWDGKKLVWEYVGAGLPDVVQQIIDGTYGLDANNPLPEPNKAISEKQVSQAESPSSRVKHPYSRKDAGLFEKGAAVEWDSPSGIVCGEYLEPEDATRSRVLLGSAELVIHNDMLRKVTPTNPIVIVDMEQMHGDEAILRKQADTLANELGYSLVASISRDDPNLGQKLAEVFAVAMGRKLIVYTEPDGTCPYMIENQRGIKPGQDWLEWMTCCECGVFLDLESNRKVGKPLMGVGNGKVICPSCHRVKYKLVEVVLDKFKPNLPPRQIELLQALAKGESVVRNAATRKALRERGFITGTNDWAKIEITEAGEAWAAENGIDLDFPIPPPQDFKPIPQASTDTLKSIKKGSTVYASEDIHEKGQVIVPAGTKGKVETRGPLALTVWFENLTHGMLCLWDMVTTAPPEKDNSAEIDSGLEYAINLADLMGADLPVKMLISPVLDKESPFNAEPGFFDGMAAKLLCDSQRAKAIVWTIRQKLKKHQLRLYSSKTGNTWKRIGDAAEIDDRAETDAWVKQVNEAVRAADAAFAEAMNTSPVVHLATEDFDVQKANDNFVKVASGGKFKSVDEFIPPKPTFAPKSRVTPLRQQYLDLKAQYPDYLVAFQLGDFFEMFDSDAEVAARDLDLVLTGRPVSRSERVPMAGFPRYSAEQYFTQLVKKGHTVVVVEQVGEIDGRGVVERKVTRVIEANGDTSKVTVDED